MVQGATPDVVLTGVELLAEVAGDTVVVDVGGATTDVHSVVELDPEDAGLSREVVATTRVTRTVEGDLGMRWSAVTTAEAAGRDDLADAAAPAPRGPRLRPRPTTPRPTSTRSSPARRSASRCAATRGAARSWSAPRGASSSAPARTSARSTCSSARAACCGTAGRASPSGSSPGSVGEHVEGGWQLPRRAEVTVDADYVLAAAGLLAAEHPEAARRLVRGLARARRSRRLTPVSNDAATGPGTPGDDGAGARFAGRLAHQWLSRRRRAPTARWPSRPGPSNFSRARGALGPRPRGGVGLAPDRDRDRDVRALPRRSSSSPSSRSR